MKLLSYIFILRLIAHSNIFKIKCIFLKNKANKKLSFVKIFKINESGKAKVQYTGFTNKPCYKKIHELLKIFMS